MLKVLAHQLGFQSDHILEFLVPGPRLTYSFAGCANSFRLAFIAAEGFSAFVKALLDLL